MKLTAAWCVLLLALGVFVVVGCGGGTGPAGPLGVNLDEFLGCYFYQAFAGGAAGDATTSWGGRSMATAWGRRRAGL